MKNEDAAKTTLLCIVDDAGTIEDMASTLQSYRLSHNVVFAGDGVDAVIRLEELNPEVIVLDLDLPKHDLDLVSKEIDAKAKDVRVIPMSGSITEHVIARCYNLGADYCILKKPLDLELFRAKVSSAVKKTASVDEDKFNKAKSDFFV